MISELCGKIGLSLVTSKLGYAAIGAIIAGVGMKYLPSLAGKYVGIGIGKLMNPTFITDPDLKPHVQVIVKELILIAEHEMSDVGQGALKKERVMSVLKTMMPEAPAAALSGLIEAVFESVKDQLVVKAVSK